ncbi:hypothetical protein IIY66_00760, partial [Candidatus Saccharibacteria bacterium]|nr:hypothetical protein [Candidatus Saccharibacteria bacterium]
MFLRNNTHNDMALLCKSYDAWSHLYWTHSRTVRPSIQIVVQRITLVIITTGLLRQLIIILPVLLLGMIMHQILS